MQHWRIERRLGPLPESTIFLGRSQRRCSSMVYISITVNVNYMSKHLTGVTALLIAITGFYPGSSYALVVYLWIASKLALMS